MDEEKGFKAKKGLSGYDATLDNKHSNSMLVNTGHSDNDIRDYIIAQQECFKRGGNWKEERSLKHHEMAKAFAIECDKRENMD